MEDFKLSNIPMPPSSNAQYAARSFAGKHAKNYVGERKSGFSLAKICPTTELIHYEKNIKETWKNQNLVAVYKCRSKLRDWLTRGQFLGVQTWAMFPYFDLYTKEGQAKRMDGTNRIKALHDCLADILEVDDSWFWSSSITKVVSKRPDPWCAVRFYAVDPLNFEQLKKEGIL